MQVLRRSKTFKINCNYVLTDEIYYRFVGSIVTRKFASKSGLKVQRHTAPLLPDTIKTTIEISLTVVGEHRVTCQDMLNVV